MMPKTFEVVLAVSKGSRKFTLRGLASAHPKFERPTISSVIAFMAKKRWVSPANGKRAVPRVDGYTWQRTRKFPKRPAELNVFRPKT